MPPSNRTIAWICASPIVAALAACMALPALAQPSVHDQSAPEAVCPPVDTRTNEDTALLATLMLEPHRTSSLADLFKLLPPEAIAKVAAMQKAAVERQARDWPNLCRYATENAQVVASNDPPRVVFIGDSITENWKLGDPSLFGSASLDRGIGGQTTPQILLRFYQDVVALRPRVVHILAGINDIMGNTGPTSDEAIVNNIRAMIDVAKANGIRVVLAGITPSKSFLAKPGLDLSPRIAAVNRQLRQLAAQQHVFFLDYGPSLTDSEGGLKAALANDGLHPNRDGYAIMRPLAEKAIARAAK